MIPIPRRCRGLAPAAAAFTLALLPAAGLAQVVRFRTPSTRGSAAEPEGADLKLRISRALSAGNAARSLSSTQASSSASAAPLADGTLVARQRMTEQGGIALDVVAYASDGLTVGGLLCYPNDGQRHSAVIHVHGGLGGIFDDPDRNMLQTCVDWARVHGRAALVPSLRGQDGSEGQPEICLGEADDVAAGARLLRSLEMTDPQRLGLVGGSLGGCVVLRAAAQIPNLRAVVAFVPPTDWRGFMEFHRTRWSSAVETRCDGATYEWSVGGPDLADTFDRLICGQPFCSDADYERRSPLPGLSNLSAPALIAAAGADNVVPFEQQVLWSILRQSAGHPVDVYTLDPCDPPGTPASASDVLLFVPDGHHLLSPNVIASGLLFLMRQLDLP
jgi:dipeptidyl aminopeptidase/acylaminoacyl peptidase